ncbi:hypothetical protein HHK36_013339 [Tetracentron sinense]|uniref:Uncharacterized protein n=1 Tax=Tetracentron sinense TaxID=13715 RepID=A0A834Z6D9_TETSI|nr:hypothetical protein HHK36_013339 [Tetracentron sinense]
MDIRSGGFPWLWNWLERQLPAQTSETQATHLKNNPTPPKPILEPEVRPQSSNYTRFGFEALDALTPKSSKSSMDAKTKHLPPLLNRSQKPNGSTPVKHAKPRTSRAES